MMSAHQAQAMKQDDPAPQFASAKADHFDTERSFAHYPVNFSTANRAAESFHGETIPNA
jgi:hypothetical protein